MCLWSLHGRKQLGANLRSVPTQTLLQTQWDSPTVRDRETSSLIKASAALSCNRLTLIAFTQTRDVEVEGKTIHIISALEWLLNSNVK